MEGRIPLFELGQSFELYHCLQGKVQQCDQQMQHLLQQWVEEKEKQDGEQRQCYPGRKKKAYKNEPKLDVQALFYQLSGGIDLAAIEGVGPKVHFLRYWQKPALI